jgi:hypothetical protein
MTAIKIIYNVVKHTLPVFTYIWIQGICLFPVILFFPDIVFAPGAFPGIKSPGERIFFSIIVAGWCTIIIAAFLWIIMGMWCTLFQEFAKASKSDTLIRFSQKQTKFFDWFVGK